MPATRSRPSPAGWSIRLARDDAFFVVTAPLVAAGGSMHQIGFIGNVVGALKVQIIGHRKPVDKPSLIKSITGLLK